MNTKSMRGRLLASSMISGAAALTLGVAAAQAADATSGGDIVTTNAVSAVASTPASGRVATITAAADAAATAEVQEVVVTGSRIPQPNLTSVSPILATSHQDFQLSGTTDVINLLNTLPQNFQNNKSDFSNTSNPLVSPGGVTTADLRGLGPQRTLVLVNGRRLGIGDPNTGDPNPAPDLDQIPVALIDHVEVLTGGASATYGSDAVAGVVNFIMKQNFEGVQIDGTAGINEHDNHQSAIRAAEIAGGITPPTGSTWDGATTDFSVIMGANAPDGKGNVTGYFEFKHATPVTQGQRDYSDCLLVLDTNPSNDVCIGSPNSNLWEPGAGPNNGNDFSVVGNSLLPFPQANSNPPAAFNSSPFEYLSRDDTRYLGGFFAHYEITPWAQPYAEFQFMSDRSNSIVGPSGAFLGSGLDGGDVDVNCNNPLASAQELTVLCGAAAGTNTLIPVLLGRRNIEGGGRTSFFEHENYRVVLGMKGDFADDAWHYDGYGSYYFTSLYTAVGGYLSIQGIQNSLNDVVGPGGTVQCAVGGSCVPWNIFQDGGVTPAALKFLTEPGTARGQTEESIFEGDLRGDLGKYGVKSPWADDGVGVALGVEHRWDQLQFAPDVAELSGDLSGFSGAAVSVNNAITVQEEYLEARIPIAQKQPFVEDLYIDGGFRYSNYSTSGGTSTYKFGGQWTPIPDFTIRGSYDRAIRAASIIEAFSPVTDTQTSVVSTDPCAASAGKPATATLAQCENTGVTPAEFGNGISPADGGTDLITQCPAGQCSTVLGGNPHLKPEIANTWSVGAVFQPTFFRGFRASVDYWDINIAGEVGVIPLTTSLQNCLNGVEVATFCPNVVRTANGRLFSNVIATGGFIVGTNQNIAAAEESGVDIQADYRLGFEDMGWGNWGSLLFHLNGVYLVSAKTQNTPSSPTYDCAGLFGPTCQTVNPRWAHTFSVSWDTPWNVLARLQWRYIDGTTLDSNSTQPGLAGNSGAFDQADNKLASRSYLDLSAAWRATSILTLRAGVNNLLDQDPPIISQPVAGIGEPNAYPTYDLLGRQIFVSATAKF